MTSSASNSVRFSAASGRALATTRRSAVVVVAVAELHVVVVAVVVVAERGGDVAALLTTRCRIFRPGCPSAMNDWFAALPFFFFIDGIVNCLLDLLLI